MCVCVCMYVSNTSPSKLFSQNKYKICKFLGKLLRGLSKKFDGINPESHIAYWSHDTLASLTKELGFKYYLPLYLGSTTANPFINIEVFDTTEPNISIYGEFIE